MPHLLTELGGRNYNVDYYVVTPQGSRGRFTMTGSVDQSSMLGATSETAVLAFLRTRHPGTDIQIQSLNWF